MNIIHIHILSVFCLFTLIFTSQCVKSNVNQDLASSKDFVSIFNGQDLTGWDGDPRFWFVENGVIVGETTEYNPTDANTYLIWEEDEPANFEVSLSFRFVMVGDDEYGNSGIMIRAKRLVNDAVPNSLHYVRGHQADMNVNDWIPGFEYEESGRGVKFFAGQRVLLDDERVRHDTRFAEESDFGGYVTHSDWTEYHVYANGDTIRTSINGRRTHEFIDQSLQAVHDGLIAFQLHRGGPMRVEFKDIQIKLHDN